MNYTYYPFQGGGDAPMTIQPPNFYQPFSDYYGSGFCQNGSYWPTAGQHQVPPHHPPPSQPLPQPPPQQMQQVNPYGFPNQGPAVNSYQASNVTNGGQCAQNNWYPNNQPPQNNLQMNSGQNQLSHDNNSISRGGVTENPGMAVECVTKLCEAVTNSINGNGTKDPITLKLNIPKFGMEMNYQKGSENGSNVSSAIEKE